MSDTLSHSLEMSWGGEPTAVKRAWGQRVAGRPGDPYCLPCFCLGPSPFD